MTWVMRKRIHQIDLFIKYPLDVQNELLHSLISTAKNTEWGIKFDYQSISTIQDFKNRVPISTYEDIFPFIERLLLGENNLLWPGKLEWFAKSSGTTNSRSKFIPVTREALDDCHYKAGKDMLSLYVNNFNYSQPFKGKTLSIGGSHEVNPDNPNISYGDVSAVLMQNLPLWAEFIRTPKLKTALLPTWEEKLAVMVIETSKVNVTNLAGVPTWILVLFQKIIETNNLDSMLDIWPNLEWFAHGGVSFDPYREQFKKLIPSDNMNYMEIYNASEGFFGIQDIPNADDMLLMLDYGMFYEFLPMEDIGKENPKTLQLDEVVLGKNYALIISTNAGLWRYMIGDTIKFTSINPFRIKITGRTKHFINAFGEEVIIENAEDAIKYACRITETSILDYTAGPIFIGDKSKGGHEWLIEFEKPPKDLDKFTSLLDSKLRELNSDYDAKREKNIALAQPKITSLEKGTFYKWMGKRGKLGGQNKVPRLANNREYLDSILELIS